MRNGEGKPSFCLLVCLIIILGLMCHIPVSAVTVSIPKDLEGILGKTVLVPVKIDTAVLLNAYLLEVSYDPNILEFIGLVPITNLAYLESLDIFDAEPASYDVAKDVVWAEDDAQTGKVTIGGWSFSPTTTIGDLFHLKFFVNPLSLVGSELKLHIEEDPGKQDDGLRGGNDLEGAEISNGYITTISPSELDEKCQIDVVINIDPSLLYPGLRVLLNLKGKTYSGYDVSEEYFWVESDPNVVNFIVDPGRYQIIAKSEDYATEYTGYFDCNISTPLDPKQIYIDEKLKPSYTVSRKDIVTDPNSPKVRLTFTFIKGDGKAEDWDFIKAPSLTLKFFDESNDLDPTDGRVDKTGLDDPNGAIVTLNSSNTVIGTDGIERLVYRVDDLGDPNFRMTNLTNTYVFAFRTESDPNFLDPNEIRIHRYEVRKVNTAQTKIAAEAKTTVNLKKGLTAKGSFDIQMDANNTNDPAVYRILKAADPNIESLSLRLNTSFADIDLFTPADPNAVFDPNTDNIDISVEYNTGVNAGLTAFDPGVEDPNDMFVVSIEFSDSAGNSVRYNPDKKTGVPLIYFDIPLPANLQDPNNYPDVEDHLIFTSAHSYSPDRFGLYFKTAASDRPELFVPDEVGGHLRVSDINGVRIARVGVPHISLWYIGEGPGLEPGAGGEGLCFVNSVMND